MATSPLITHEDTKPLSPAMDRLVNEAFHYARSKHRLSQMFFFRPGRGGGNGKIWWMTVWFGVKRFFFSPSNSLNFFSVKTPADCAEAHLL